MFSRSALIMAGLGLAKPPDENGRLGALAPLSNMLESTLAGESSWNGVAGRLTLGTGSSRLARSRRHLKEI